MESFDKAKDFAVEHKVAVSISTVATFGLVGAIAAIAAHRQRGETITELDLGEDPYLLETETFSGY